MAISGQAIMFKMTDMWTKLPNWPIMPNFNIAIQIDIKGDLSKCMTNSTQIQKKMIKTFNS